MFAVLLTAHLALRYPMAQSLPLARMCIALVASLRSGPSVSPGLAAVSWGGAVGYFPIVFTASLPSLSPFTPNY